MGKSVKKGLDLFKNLNMMGWASTGTQKASRPVAEGVGIATPEALKQQQRAAELAARQSAEAAALAASNLEKNQLVDLTDASNSPDVIAGGTANQLGLGGDMRKKRAPGLATQLGVRI